MALSPDEEELAFQPNFLGVAMKLRRLFTTIPGLLVLATVLAVIELFLVALLVKVLKE